MSFGELGSPEKWTLPADSMSNLLGVFEQGLRLLLIENYVLLIESRKNLPWMQSLHLKEEKLE